MQNIHTFAAVVGLALAVAACSPDPRKAEIEARNAAYAQRQAAEPIKPLQTPPPPSERQVAEMGVAVSCTPEREGYPVDQEACDKALAAFKEFAAEDAGDLVAP